MMLHRTILVLAALAVGCSDKGDRTEKREPPAPAPQDAAVAADASTQPDAAFMLAPGEPDIDVPELILD